MSGLIVPIEVTAFCVGAADAEGPARKFAGGTTDFSNQVTGERPAFLGINVTRDFDEAPLWPLEKGVHLHWTMPDALTRADGAGDALQFPALPNRWLVSRVAGTGTTSKHWIVESDSLSITPPGGNHAPTVPVAGGQSSRDDQRTFRFLGVTQLFTSDWREPDAGGAEPLRALTGSPLHAVATGDLAFAAFYPNSRSIFGFHDDLSDLAGAVELMYVVTGWYSTPANDPLRAGLSVATLQAQFRWTFSSQGAETPAFSLYNGTVQRIQFDPNRRYCEDDPTPVAANMAVGNHPAEALAAYLRGTNHPAIAAFEELLTLFITGLLPTFNTPAPGQLALIEELLHELQFTGVDGGTIYTITSGADSSPDLPLALADALNKLNSLRQAADVAAMETRQARWQLFACWMVLFLVDPNDNTLRNDAFSAFSDELSVQPAISHHQQTAERAAAVQETVVRNALSAGLTLTRIPAERYYRPTEPVVLLAGDAAASPHHFGGDGRFRPDGFLLCRLDSALLESVKVASSTLEAKQFAGLLPPNAGQLPRPAITLLIEEAALLNTSVASAASGAPEDQLATGLIQWLRDGTNTVYADPVGQPPSPVAVAFWQGENPWYSLLLLWDAHFHPLLSTIDGATPVDYASTFFTANYALDPDHPRMLLYSPTASGIQIDPAAIDFNPDHSGSGTQRYSGAALLSSSAADNLRTQLAKYLAITPDRTLEAIASQLTGTNVALQSLSGWNDALTTRRRSLQVSIGVSSSAQQPFQTATQELRQVVTSLSQIPALEPSPNGSYNPVRAGYLRLSLRVVDPFGRKRPVEIRNLFTADTLTVYENATAVPNIIYVQPRLAQASRLLFRWIAADSTEFDEMNVHPATTPICGWLLPSHTNESFFLYNAQGNPLGSLSLRDDGGGIEFQAAPGDQATIDQNLDEVMRDQNPHLRAVALALFESSPPRFRAFWQAADSGIGQIVPPAGKSQSGLAALVGRPLALTQASLRLERQGFPEFDQTFNTLLAGDTPDQHAVDGVQFPVVIGDLKRLDDGLVGYFKSSADSTYDTSVFYSEAAPSPGDPGVVQPAVTNLLLSPAAAAPNSPAAPTTPETKVLLLIDPRAAVHATMGILPRQALSIPSSQYEDIVAGLEFTFPAHPLLRPAGGMAIPFPAVSGFNQSWVTEERGDGGRTRWAVDPAIQPPTAGAVWNYTPQTLSEGWLRLNPELLRFRLLNGRTPVVSAGATEDLTLTILNTRPVAITFTPAAGSAFFVHLSSLVDPNQVPSIRFSAQGWSFELRNDAANGNYWAAAPTSSPVTVPPGAAITMALSNVVISTTAKAQARVDFVYQDLQGIDDGIDQAILTVSGLE